MPVNIRTLTSQVNVTDSNIPIRNAPRGGVTMLRIPYNVWFIPPTRVSWSLGTISDVEACIAGP